MERRAVEDHPTLHYMIMKVRLSVPPFSLPLLSVSNHTALEGRDPWLVTGSDVQRDHSCG